MTELTFQKKTFLATLDALQRQFDLNSNAFTLETTGEEQFRLAGRQRNGSEVAAFGPCSVAGPLVSLEIDLADLDQAIRSAHGEIETDSITLVVGDGLWVKDASPVKSGA